VYWPYKKINENVFSLIFLLYLLMGNLVARRSNSTLSYIRFNLEMSRIGLNANTEYSAARVNTNTEYSRIIFGRSMSL